jgi:hypothetical protein
MVVLFSHARSGGCACIVPEKLANLLGVSEPLRSIPITEPRELHIIGLVAPYREPIPPLTRALVAEASMLAMPQKQGLERVPRGFASVPIDRKSR